MRRRGGWSECSVPGEGRQMGARAGGVAYSSTGPSTSGLPGCEGTTLRCWHRKRGVGERAPSSNVIRDAEGRRPAGATCEVSASPASSARTAAAIDGGETLSRAGRGGHRTATPVKVSSSFATTALVGPMAEPSPRTVRAGSAAQARCGCDARVLSHFARPRAGGFSAGLRRPPPHAPGSTLHLPSP